MPLEGLQAAGPRGSTLGLASTQLAIGFVAQQTWVDLADDLGGLATVLCASAGTAMAMIGLQVMQHEIDLRPAC